MVSLDLTIDLHPTAQNYARAESLGLTVDLHPTAEYHAEAVQLALSVHMRATAENRAQGGVIGPTCRFTSDRGELCAGQ